MQTPFRQPLFLVLTAPSGAGKTTLVNLLRAEFGVKPGQGGAVSDYLNLRDYWRVTPWLETRLSGMLERHLGRYV